MPSKNTTASLVLAMPCLSINFHNQKSAYYQGFIKPDNMRFVMDKELVFSKGRIFQTLDTGIDNRSDN